MGIILIKYPVRDRVEKAYDTLKTALSNVESKDGVIVSMTIDTDDMSFLSHDVVNRFSTMVQSYSSKLIINFNDERGKIKACNFGMDYLREKEDWDIVVLLSDDMVCVKKGWDLIIREKMKALYPDFDGCLWFNDGYTKDRLCTMVIMGIKYFDRFRYLYNGEYKSFWCDNEQTIVAQKLNKISYFPDVLFMHQHPSNTFRVKNDGLYMLNQSYISEDYHTFERRKKRNFDLSI